MPEREGIDFEWCQAKGPGGKMVRFKYSLPPVIAENRALKTVIEEIEQRTNGDDAENALIDINLMCGRALLHEEEGT